MARKKPVDLGDLADRVNEALYRVHEAGLVDEADTIRTYIHASASFFSNAIKVNREVNGELNRQLKEMHAKRPTVKTDG